MQHVSYFISFYAVYYIRLQQKATKNAPNDELNDCILLICALARTD